MFYNKLNMYNFDPEWYFGHFYWLYWIPMSNPQSVISIEEPFETTTSFLMLYS